MSGEQKEQEKDKDTVRLELLANEAFNRPIAIVPAKRTQIVIQKPKQEISG